MFHFLTDAVFLAAAVVFLTAAGYFLFPAGVSETAEDSCLITTIPLDLAGDFLSQPTVVLSSHAVFSTMLHQNIIECIVANAISNGCLSYIEVFSTFEIFCFLIFDPFLLTYLLFRLFLFTWAMICLSTFLHFSTLLHSLLKCAILSIPWSTPINVLRHTDLKIA